MEVFSLHFSDFIIKFEDFLSGHIDKEDFLDRLELIENDLLDMEEISRETQQSTGAIVKSLEIIDDISIILEAEECHFSELKVCLEKLIELKIYFDRNEYSSDKTEKISDSMGQLKFTEPSFGFHPHMKFKMPLEKPVPERCDLSDIELKISPLYNLIESAKNYISSGETMTGFCEILKKTCREVLELTEEGINSDDSFIYFLEECLEKINEIEDFMEEPDFMEELPAFIEELQILNEKFINFQRLPLQDKIEMTEDKLIDELLKRIAQENFITSNYLLVSNKLESFLKHETDEEDIKKILSSIKEIIISSREDYEKSYISPEEWTLEVYAGDKMLSEGLEEWEEGLTVLEYCFVNRNKEEIDKAISMVFEGNKKLVLNQYLAEYIEEQIVLSKTYSEKDFGDA
jgi:hypothetical protein